MKTIMSLFFGVMSQPIMGNTGTREKSQQSVDDSGPTLLQSPMGYSSRAGEDYPSSNRVIPVFFKCTKCFECLFFKYNSAQIIY